MKLLFCGHCNDVVRLFPEPRYCKCGKSWGQYLPDNSTTIQTSYTASIGVANPDFSQALDTLMADRDHFSPLLAIRAWLNPDSEADVRYIAEDVTPEQAARQGA